MQQTLFERTMKQRQRRDKAWAKRVARGHLLVPMPRIG
jgi:hypothetical protein